MGIVVAKHPYISVSTSDTSNNFSSINIDSYDNKNGMSLVHQNGVHRQHFRRVLTPATTRGITAGGNAKKIPASARRSAY